MNQLAFAATAGMLAAFNPCGFALLPGYLTLFLGQQAPRSSVVWRALAVGAAVTAGFVAVFGALGAAIAALSLALGSWLAVLTLLSGAALAAIGAAQILGRDLWVRVPRARLRVNRSVAGMVGYGIIYATVSLSCTLPVFSAAVVSGFAGPGATMGAGTLSALSYAAGMGLVMTTLALAIGVLGRGALTRTRTWSRHVGRASGLMVLTAAAYVLWYGWVELATYTGTKLTPGPVTWVAKASGRVNQFLTETGDGTVLLALVGVLASAVLTTLISRHRRASTRGPLLDPDEPARGHTPGTRAGRAWRAHRTPTECLTPVSSSGQHRRFVRGFRQRIFPRGRGTTRSVGAP